MNSKFDEKVVCGDKYVALREIESGKVMESGGLVLSESSMANAKMGFYVVEAVGHDAEENYGLKVGDYVFADRLASFYHSTPVCLMEYTNVIVRTNKDKSEYYPLKNMVFVEEDKNEFKDSGSGFYISNDSNHLRLGTIIDMNISEDDFNDYPFKIGDHVMLVRGGDFVKFGQTEFFIFKPEQIICKIIDR